MDEGNCSSLTEFFLLGITNNPEMKMALFATFLVVYLINVLANLGMISLIRVDSQLHTPMYFFVSHLSFSDLCYSSAVRPKMLVDLLTKSKSIPFIGCALQFFFCYMFVDFDCLLLTMMAFDWYKAINDPLLYAVDMSSRLCSVLVASIYLLGVVYSLIHTSMAFHLCFCGSKEINHFFCDILPILLISYSDTQINELLIFTIFGFIELSTISGVLVSYFYIILSVTKIHSAEWKIKAFSTCASHLTAVAIFQGTMMFMYFQPSSSYFLDQDKKTSLFYSLVIPMLNLLV